jgi:hypothetical protein
MAARPSIRFYEDPEFLRRQTLFLLIAFGCILLSTLTPLFNFGLSESPALPQITLTANRIVSPPLADKLLKISEKQQIYTLLQTVFLALSAGLVMGALTLYRQRKRQLQFVRLIMGFLLMLTTTLTANLLSLQSMLRSLDEANILSVFQKVEFKVMPDFGLVFLLTPLILLVVADKAIRADIARLRKMERFW